MRAAAPHGATHENTPGRVSFPNLNPKKIHREQNKVIDASFHIRLKGFDH
jgi:hypothetical protein